MMTEVAGAVMAEVAGTARGRCTISSAQTAAKMPRFRSSRSATDRSIARNVLDRCAMSAAAPEGEVFAEDAKF